MSKRIVSLARTAKALADFDAHPYEYDCHEDLAKAVGVAYGYDTAEFNNFEDCSHLIRPGNPNPGHPDDLSFVRRMVNKWVEQCG